MLSWDSSRWGAQVANILGNCAQAGSVRKQQDLGLRGLRSKEPLPLTWRDGAGAER